MIDINITIIVQIVHFLIAYALLRKFLWRFVLARLDEHAHQQEGLDHELQQQAQLALAKSEQVAQVWQEARQSFAIQVPTFTRHVGAIFPRASAPVLASSDISPARVEQLATLIVERARQ